MDRRNFLRSLVGGVAVTAAARTFPFRVFSFPLQITVPSGPFLRELEIIYYDKSAIDALQEMMMYGSSVWRIKRLPKEELKRIRLTGYPLNV